TYHGPGQRVAYVMLDLKKRQQTPDIKKYICDLEQWIINTLAEFDINGERREGRVGIWVKTPHPSFTRVQDTLSRGERESEHCEQDEGECKEAKIAAIGVRVRHWVTYHGISINLNPDLSNFSDIVPCGISDAGVTSFEDLGVSADMDQLDEVLRKECLF
ncbi:MAG: hypothetical protein CMH31_04750, partial [Micavibrio sp.]|nr:hypothetical protein [Micavibrio sp.]